MSLSSLPVELLTLVAQELDRKSLKQFTLVSTCCRTASRTLLWRHINLHVNGSHDENELLLFIRSERELGEGVTDLRMCYLTENVYYERWHLEVHDLLELPLLFPHIISLSIEYADSTEPIFLDEAVNHTFSFLTFCCLTHLTFDSSLDPDFHHLRHILALSPNLVSFKLTERSEGADSINRKLTTCPVLKHLEIYTEGHHELFSPHWPLFPYLSISKLETLKIFRESYLEDLEAILDCSSSTLKSFSYGSFDTVPYQDIQFILPKMLVLESLEMSTLRTPPPDFLQNVPSSMKYLKIALGRNHLEHFRDNPRPELQLYEIIIENWTGWSSARDNREEEENFDLLPRSIRTLTIDNGVYYVDLLDLYVGLKEMRSVLKLQKLSVCLINVRRTQECFSTGQRRLLSIFRDINIWLEFRDRRIR